MHQTGSEYIYEINGYGKQMKKVFAVFLVASLSLVGVPPLAGFDSKCWLDGAGVASGISYASSQTGSILAYLGVGALLLSALLTAVYLFTILILAYFPDALPNPSTLANPGIPVTDPNWYMILPLVLFAVAVVVLGLGQKELYDLFCQITQGL